MGRKKGKSNPANEINQPSDNSNIKKETKASGKKRRLKPLGIKSRLKPLGIKKEFNVATGKNLRNKMKKDTEKN